MELAGVAADIADIGSHGHDAASAPLALFGCVGEGAPSDAMAKEALQLWVEVSRTPPESWGPPPAAAAAALLPGEEDGGAGAAGDGNDDGRRCSFHRTGAKAAAATAAEMDGPVLKAVFCASNAIRAQLARSLLSVCGGGSTGGTAATATGAAAGSLSAAATSGDTVQAGEVAPPPQGAAPTPPPVAAAVVVPAAASVALVAAPRQDAAESEVVRNDLREHVVRLLLDNIPRNAKPVSSAPAPRGREEHGGRGAVSLACRRRRRGGGRREGKDCSQFFDVLCALVEKSIKLAEVRERTGGGLGGGGRLDVDGLAADVVERLLAHPCTERRGAREADKDTLLVSRKNKNKNIIGTMNRERAFLFRADM